MQGMWIQSLGQEDPMEKERATHCNIFAWETPWTEDPGGLQSMGWQRARQDLVTIPQEHSMTLPMLILAY